VQSSLLKDSVQILRCLANTECGPQFGIAVAVLIVALLALAIYYRSTARETERLESVFRSMVLARVVEGLSGSATLQAYGMYSGFTAKLHAALDDMNAASFSTVAIQRWLSLRQDAVTILALVVLGCLILIKRDTQHPAISGVSISLMINAIQVIQVVVREWAEVEAAMNATDRLHAYANTLPQEEPEQHGSSPQSLSTAKDIWPETGTITMRNLSMKYRPDLPESLKDIDMKIESGEHIAIVGRTGAGKSSVVNALFRFTALSKGEIMIDGRDISKMPLQKLRSSLAIIPQETTLFSGTVRSNLDPFGEHSDDELHTALDKSHLSQRLSLADVITPEGSNLSVGQRQLLALARVLLRRSKILVCDEATSSLDTDTDGLIQLTMKKAFEGKTVICIAHRLGSVLWYDRVVVLDEGRLVEVGTPLELWDRGNNNDTRNDSSSGEKMGGVFRGMCEEAGITRNMAQDAAGWRERQVNEKTSDQNSGEAMGTEK
jgi:ABC-type multidrug transport system fused ATPase/permease subunit